MSTKKIRVLVVDDSVAIRRIISNVLQADPAIEVAGVAANGRIALQMVTQVVPDLMLLDVEMPELDGLGVLRELRKTHPRLPVIMFSSLTERGAAATIEALTLGASDYVTKPSNAGNAALAIERVREGLIPKIKSLCGETAATEASSTPFAANAVSRTAFSSSGRAVAPAPRGSIDIVAVGVSTGGPNALAAIIPELPIELRVPVVIVQHMPPLFTKLLAGRLNAQSKVEVREAVAGEELLPGTVYIAPGDFHLTVERKGAKVVTGLNQAPPENSCRPSVDVLFRSVADVYRSSMLAVVLTGMGQDGLRGCEAVRQAGGAIYVQDESTSIVWGMPGFIARAGIADRVLPLPSVAQEIARAVAATAAPQRGALASLAK